jgi:hypothetical protein
MYGWLAAPLVLVAGSSPAGHAPAKAESSRTVSEPPFCGVAEAVVLDPELEPDEPEPLVLLLPHAASATATATTQIATPYLTR